MRALMVGIVIGLAAGLLFQELRYRNLRKLNQQLAVNVDELRKQIAAREPAITPVDRTDNEEQSELLRLRNQAAQLRAATNELRQLRAQLDQARASAQTPGAAPGSAATTAELVPREAWSFAGYATPQAAFHSTMFAHSQGDHQTFLASLTGDLARDNQKELNNKTPEQFSENLRRETAKFTGYRILEMNEVSPEETVLMIYYAGESDTEKVTMRKVGDEWKLAGPPTDKGKPQ
jgi:uncharacterized membrane-anchored protein YhcB (DUF1043 family)